MEPLSVHLAARGDHAGIGFHPRCPVCLRAQLSATLSLRPLTSGRGAAVLATGVLAFSSATAVATVPDQQQEGVALSGQLEGAAPQAPGQSDGADSPAFDPGGDTALPFEVGPEAPVTEVDPGAVGGDGQEQTGETGQLETEPNHDPDAQPVPLDEPVAQSPSSGAEAQVPPAEVPAPEPPSTSVPAAPVDNVSAEAAPTTPASPPPDGPRRHKQSASAPAPRTSHRPKRETAATPVSSYPAVAPAPDPVAAPMSSAEDSGDGGSPSRGARLHVVEAGESLWSIARDLLGPDASEADVAHEVRRLWQLNRVRIGTGDPDLLMVGFRLRLR